jgi:cytidylate kinase
LNANLENLVEEIAARDSRDAQRTVAPLKPAPDAEILDTTLMGVAEVCDWALALATRKLATPEIRQAKALRQRSS